MRLEAAQRSGAGDRAARQGELRRRPRLRRSIGEFLDENCNSFAASVGPTLGARCRRGPMDRLEELTGPARLLELRRKMEEVKRSNDAEKRRLTVRIRRAVGC